MIIKRRKTRVIKVGKLKIGGTNPILVQSMTKNKIENLKMIKSEIKELINCNCEIIRIAIPKRNSINYLKSLMNEKVFSVPIVADIHFDYKLALDCLDIGVDCVRINPGNIGNKKRLAEIIKKAEQKKAAIRIGVNSGSIEKRIFNKNNGNIVESMVESILENVKFFEKLGFYNFKISAKASSVLDTINIYEILSEKINYPLHIGITEAGTLMRGSIKSSVGMGILLAKGIGDTIRVSLTGKSADEVKAGYLILNSLNLRKFGVDIISCPTCGRTQVDLINFAHAIEDITKNIKKGLKIAVMGCIVNGPGEAKESDIGIAFGKKKAAIFVKGKILKRLDINNILEEFVKELYKIV
jgi:(E)-4-hydroxy-3-methylbut-2-enyl-diphosphate synthase